MSEDLEKFLKEYDLILKPNGALLYYNGKKYIILRYAGNTIVTGQMVATPFMKG